MSNKKFGTLYVGLTNNLLRRVYEHKKNFFKRSTSKYSLDKLVYAEETCDICCIEKRKTNKEMEQGMENVPDI
jgi:predicted GIY-YIG superfamily endonuclease